MVIDELDTSAHVRLAQVLSQLHEQHSIHLDFLSADFDLLMQVYEECAVTRKTIVESTAHNSYIGNQRYVEASLIQEAIKIFLSEVAPKRLKRRLRSVPSFGANNE